MKTISSSLNTKPLTSQRLSSRPCTCFVAVAACAVLWGTTHASGREVTIRIAVSTAGVDSSQPAGARELYSRLRKAAWIACTHGMRVGLEPVDSFSDCYAVALGTAVHSVHQRQLNFVYLLTHTARDAAAFDIEVPAAVGVTDWPHLP